MLLECLLLHLLSKAKSKIIHMDQGCRRTLSCEDCNQMGSIRNLCLMLNGMDESAIFVVSKGRFYFLIELSGIYDGLASANRMWIRKDP